MEGGDGGGGSACECLNVLGPLCHRTLKELKSKVSGKVSKIYLKIVGHPLPEE